MWYDVRFFFCLVYNLKKSVHWITCRRWVIIIKVIMWPIMQINKILCKYFDKWVINEMLWVVHVVNTLSSLTRQRSLFDQKACSFSIKLICISVNVPRSYLGTFPKRVHRSWMKVFFAFLLSIENFQRLNFACSKARNLLYPDVPFIILSVDFNDNIKHTFKYQNTSYTKVLNRILPRTERQIFMNRYCSSINLPFFLVSGSWKFAPIFEANIRP